ncbi:MAG: porin family protein [Chitinophagaceae bacterium]
MKTLFYISINIAIFLFAASAQPIRFGFNAGVTSSFMNSKYQGLKEETDGTQKFGITAGIMADIKLTRSLCLTPSLNFTQKGAVYRYENAGIARGERTLNYTELLLNVLYGVPAGNGRFSIGLGTVISFGMSGKYKDEMNYGSSSSGKRTGDVKFGTGPEDEYKPLDFGGNIMTAYEFSSGITLALNYYMGLNNLAVNDFGGNTVKNRYLGVRVGYFLSRLHKK